MSQLFKIAGWEDGARLNVIFVHGLGGHPFDTWRRDPKDSSFWPVWLASEIPGTSTWALAYEAPSTNWLGTAMPIQDRAKNVLETLLGQRELRGAPIVFVCHSLGGLVVKQVLRAADARRAYGDAESRAFLDSVKGVVFIATPHTGSTHATMLDRLRLLAWPSASTLDLVHNNANLRDLNVWYRNWSAGIEHKVFFEKRTTAAGVIVDDDSSDPGLLHIDPIGIDADHPGISKPAATNSLVCVRTRDFVLDQVLKGHPAAPEYGKVATTELPNLPRMRPHLLVPITLRLILIAVLAALLFKGAQAVLFPRDPLSRQAIHDIKIALRNNSNLTAPQIDQFVQSLHDIKADRSFERAIASASQGQPAEAEGIMRQIYENTEKELIRARRDQARAARNIGASAIAGDRAEGLKWYRKATDLDSENMSNWLGLGYAALSNGKCGDSKKAFRQYQNIAYRINNEREIAVGLIGLGEALDAEGKFSEALEEFRHSLEITERRATADRNDDIRQQDLSVSKDRVGAALLKLTEPSEGNLSEALRLFRSSLEIRERLAEAETGNFDRQRDLSISHEMIGDALLKRGDLPQALLSFEQSMTIRAGLARRASGRPGLESAQLQHDLSLVYARMGEVREQQKDIPRARAAYHVSIDILRNLVAKNAHNFEWHYELVTNLRALGNILQQGGDLDGAGAAYGESLDRVPEVQASEDCLDPWPAAVRASVGKMGSLAFRYVLARRFDEAIKAADKAISRRRDQVWLYANRAHALMLLGRAGEAEAIYLGYRSSAVGGKTWEDSVEEDFDKLREANITHPMMDQISAKFREGKP